MAARGTPAVAAAREGGDSAATSTRDLDVTVIGASGVTGRLVVKRLVELSSTPGVSWRVGAAGRNAGRTKESLASVGVAWDSVAFCEVDAFKPELLAAAARRSHLIVNCSGPFRTYGEPVVRACVDNGCHYIDISGEPEFIERMEATYSAKAEAAGVLVVSACGFDSIPADLGTMYTLQEFARAGGVAASVESYLAIDCPVPYRGHFTTWECAVLGVGHANQLAALRRAAPRVRVPLRGPPLARSSWPRRVREVGPRFALPFMGSDASIVRRTMRRFVTATGEERLGEHKQSEGGTVIARAGARLPANAQPVQFAAYFLVASRLNVLLVMLVGAVFMVLAKFAFGRRLLLRFPRLFSANSFTHEGPSQEAMQRARFSITFRARGHRADSTALAANPKTAPLEVGMLTRVSGPDPGYIGTSKMTASCAFVILEHLRKAPRNARRCGVLTTAHAFWDTPLVARLRGEGFTFEVVKPLDALK